MLVARCLAKNPAERFASGTELAQAISALITNVTGPGIGVMAPHQQLTVTDPNTPKPTTLAGAAAQASGISGTSPPRSGGHGRLIAIGGAAIVAIGVGIGVIAMGGSKTDKAAAPLADPVVDPVADPVVVASPTPDATPARSPDPTPVVTPDAAAKLAITVETNPPGAHVFVDKESDARGLTPYTFDLAAGTPPFEMKLSYKGHKSKTVTVKPGTDTKLSFTLDKAVARPGTGDDADDIANPFAKKKKTP
jgi:hypothetical protein